MHLHIRLLTLKSFFKSLAVDYILCCRNTLINIIVESKSSETTMQYFLNNTIICFLFSKFAFFFKISKLNCKWIITYSLISCYSNHRFVYRNSLGCFLFILRTRINETSITYRQITIWNIRNSHDPRTVSELKFLNKVSNIFLNLINIIITLTMRKY